MRGRDREFVGGNPVMLIDPLGNDWVTTGLGFVGYVSSTVGMTGYVPAKIVGVGASSAAIIYTGLQYKLGNMSGTEAAREIGLASANILSSAMGVKLPNAGNLAGGITRALGIGSTAYDAVTTMAENPTPAPAQITSAPGSTAARPSGKLF